MLLVDDDRRARAALTPSLAASVGRVVEAESAEMALYACRTHAVDVVASSARLPGMNADALCAELRDHGGPPVVAYGLGSSAGRPAEWLDGGGADCLATSDPRLLAARCRAVLRRSRRGGARPSPAGDADR